MIPSHKYVMFSGGAPDGWAPGGAAPVSDGWPPADTAAVANAGNGGWNADGWVEEQPPSEEDTQEGGWVEEEGAQPVNADGGWPAQGVAPQQAGWAEPNGNVANGWANSPPQAPVVNAPPPNGWAAQPNAQQANGWNAGPPQAGNDNGGWAAPQQGGNGWAPPAAAGPVQQGGQSPTQVNGWNPGPTQAENAGWDQNAGGWSGPATNGGWNNGAQAPEGGGWNNGQQNGGWNGLQDAGLSWKVYNEDTQTMENLDDNSAWKVVGDGGSDGWKLVDENGNVEWKIENINGEWKVTSADELPTVDNSTAAAVDATNGTTESANSTSEEVEATTPAPGGGWDDDKQGRYIVWKFTDDGKGEARVYGGGGAEPEVWKVGDNNQYWKETMGIKSNDNSGQVANAGWSPDGTVWQTNGGWQNTYNPGSGSWQNGGSNAPQQNNGWQNGGVSPQVTGTSWQNGGPAAPSAAGWQAGANTAPKPNGGRGWKAGNAGQQGGGNGWKQKVVRPAAPQTTAWSNSGTAPQQTGGWQNQQPQSNGAWNGGSSSPQIPAGWQTTGAGNQPTNGGSQGAWQNGATAPQSGGGWAAPGTSGKKARTKGRWRNPANGNRNANGWQPKPANVKSGAREAWNNGNRNSAWAQRNPGAVQSSWNNAPSPSVAPAVNANPQNAAVWQNGASQAGLPAGWSANGKNGQTVPYIIVIKTPEGAAAGQGAPNSWPNGSPGVPASGKKARSRNKPRNNRRSSGWKMNRAGSSGWQWNPQGGREGWKWMDGWMGSGGGFGGWMSDKDTMYSGWRPTNTNGQSPAEAKAPDQAAGGAAKSNKKAGSKMVFVFGTKRNSSGGWTKPSSKKKNKQVIILDYTTAGKKAPKGEDGMKKDIESVIQALKTGKPANAQGRTVWKQPPQVTNQQQWGG